MHTNEIIDQLGDTIIETLKEFKDQGLL